MSSQVHVSLAGYLGQDAQMQYMPSGTPVLRFSVAGQVGFGQKEETQWISCSLFGKRAESLHQYLTKGTLVFVEGTLSQAINRENSWFNVNVNDIGLLGGGQERSEPVLETEAASDIPF